MAKRGFLDGYKTYDVSEKGYGSPWEWRKQFHHRMSKDEADTILGSDDPYLILEIKLGATKSEIKKAFYRMALKWHPDRNSGNEFVATEMMKKINAAYTKLTN